MRKGLNKICYKLFSIQLRTNEQIQRGTNYKKNTFLNIYVILVLVYLLKETAICFCDSLGICITGTWFVASYVTKVINSSELTTMIIVSRSLRFK